MRDGKKKQKQELGRGITHSCIPLYTGLGTYSIIIFYNVNAGMGNTGTLHPNSCFCSFSIPTSKNFCY